MTDDTIANLVFPAPEVPLVPIEGSAQLFPARRIYCVGRNYEAHIREMNGDEREPPFFFQKPADSLVLDDASIPYPSSTGDLQHEIELVLAIGEGGENIATEDAARHVFGVAVGVDLTRRDLQLSARDKGRPWEAGKSFDASAPIGKIHPTAGNTIPAKGQLTLKVNGELRQQGDISDMIWSSTEIISQLSRLFRLEPGDLIYTGTPAGVREIGPGDQVEGQIEGVGTVSFNIVE